MSEALDAAWTILKYGEGLYGVKEGECAVCGKQDALYLHPNAGHGAEPSLCRECYMYLASNPSASTNSHVLGYLDKRNIGNSLRFKE